MPNCRFSARNSLSNDKFLVRSKFKGFGDDRINVTEKLKIVLERAENIVGKEENAGYHFLPFPQCFQKVSFSRLLKIRSLVNTIHFSRTLQKKRKR